MNLSEPWWLDTVSKQLRDEWEYREDKRICSMFCAGDRAKAIRFSEGWHKVVDYAVGAT